MNYKIFKINNYEDSRGWLKELFRIDEGDVQPVMGYVSQTKSGVSRGPHMHEYQTDIFYFFNGLFKLYLWEEDNPKPDIHYVGEDNPVCVIVPPHIIHAYKNIGQLPGLVVNCPNKLYKGEGKQEEVDEVRFEEDENSLYVIKGQYE